jgi:RNA polymerase sigma-70 factor (sigma-E family)
MDGPGAQPCGGVGRRGVVTLVEGQMLRVRPDLTVDLARLDADAAVTALFDEHYPRMVRVAVVLVGDVASAEDVVQEAFLALHAAWGRVSDKTNAAGYLHRSVVNGARSRLRRNAVAQRFRPTRVPDVDSAEDSALSGLASGSLVVALRALPRREREVVLLRHYLDLSEKQTADALGLRRGSVKAYASRGLARLRSVLGDRLEPEEGAR